MYYVTRNIMVCPPLDGLASSDVFAFDPEYASLTNCMNFMGKLRTMLPADDETEGQSNIHSQVLRKVATYMNNNHGSDYIVYNLFNERQLDHASSFLHQVTEYLIPKANLVQGLAHAGLL